MPRLDGFGLLRKMRLEELNTPTMVLTARNQPDDVKQAITLKAGTSWPSRSRTSSCCGGSVGCCARRPPGRQGSAQAEEPPPVMLPIDEGPEPFLLCSGERRSMFFDLCSLSIPGSA